MGRKREEKPQLIVVGEQEAPQPKAAPAPAPKRVRIPMTFDAWWLLKQSQYGLRPELKESVRKHLEARGFMADEDFDEGLRDFGIKT